MFNINLKVQLVAINSIIVILVLVFSTFFTMYTSRESFNDLSETINLEIDKSLDKNIRKAAEITQNIIVQSQNNLLRDSKLIADSKILKNALEYKVVSKGELIERDNGYIQKYRKIRPLIDYRLIAGELKENFYYSQNALTHIDIYNNNGKFLGSTAGIPDYVLDKDPNHVKAMFTYYEGYIDTLDILSNDDGVSLKVYQKVNETHGIVGISTPINLDYLQEIKNITDTEIILYKGPSYIEGTIFEFGKNIEKDIQDTETDIFNQISRNKEIIITGNELYPDKLLNLGVINGKELIKKYRFAFIPLSNIKGEVVGMIGVAISSSNLEEALNNANSKRVASDMHMIAVFLHVAVISLIIAMFLIYLYANTITKPISKILSTVYQVAQGNLKPGITIKRRDEIGELSFGINHMIMNLKEIEIEKQKRKVSEELRDINFSLSSILDRDKLLVNIIHKIQDYINFDNAFILLLNKEKYEILKFNFDDNTLDLYKEIESSNISHSLHQIINYKEPTIIDNFSASLFSNEPIDSILSIPILFQDSVIGNIILEYTKQPKLPTINTDMIFAITSQSGIALENATIFNRINKKTKELSAYFEKIKSIRDTVLTIHGMRDKNTAIYFIINRLLELEPQYNSAIYYEYQSLNNTLTCINAIYKNGETVDLIKKSIDINKNSKVKELINNIKDKHNIIKSSKNGILEYLIPVYHEDKIYGLISLNTDPKYDLNYDNKIDILNIFSSNLALYIENQTKYENFFKSEKMKSLIHLVTGIAHEMNTPVGICITSSSYLNDQTMDIKEKIDSGNIKKSELENFLDSAITNQDLIIRNLDKTKDLINNFKKIAVVDIDKNQEEYNLKEFIGSILNVIKRSLNIENKYTIKWTCPDYIFITHNKIIIKDIIEKVIDNALIHGFANREDGTIEVSIINIDNTIILNISNDGNSIEKKNIDRIFDPFFTTRRGSNGGVGLGLNYVYNLVTHNLNGTISCESIPNKKTTFTISFNV